MKGYKNWEKKKERKDAEVFAKTTQWTACYRIITELAETDIAYVCESYFMRHYQGRTAT